MESSFLVYLGGFFGVFFLVIVVVVVCFCFVFGGGGGVNKKLKFNQFVFKLQNV